MHLVVGNRPMLLGPVLGGMFLPPVVDQCCPGQEVKGELLTKMTTKSDHSNNWVASLPAEEQLLEEGIAYLLWNSLLKLPRRVRALLKR